jgi:hypothetical protein
MKLHRGWLSLTYGYDRRRYGIPVEPGEVDFEYLKMRRHNFEVKGGLKDLNSFIEGGDFPVSYNDYRHTEFEFESDENVTEIESRAFNKNFNYRANFNHRRIGKMSGTFGFSGFTRDYESVGEEAPAPRTRQNSFATYALERLDFERVGFQFDGVGAVDEGVTTVRVALGDGLVGFDPVAPCENAILYAVPVGTAKNALTFTIHHFDEAASYSTLISFRLNKAPRDGGPVGKAMIVASGLLFSPALSIHASIPFGTT